MRFYLSEKLIRDRQYNERMIIKIIIAFIYIYIYAPQKAYVISIFKN